MNTANLGREYSSNQNNDKTKNIITALQGLINDIYDEEYKIKDMIVNKINDKIIRSVPINLSKQIIELNKIEKKCDKNNDYPIINKEIIQDINKIIQNISQKEQITLGGKTNKRKTNKRKTNKRKTNKQKTNKRKTNKQKTNKQKTNKRIN